MLKLALVVAEILQREFFMEYQIMFSFNQNKFVFNKIYFYDVKIYFYSMKINFYSIKYMYINISMFSFNQNKFIFKKKYFCYITFFSIQLNFFYYINFSFDTFLVTISGLPFLFGKVRILLSAYKSNSSTMM